MTPISYKPEVSDTAGNSHLIVVEFINDVVSKLVLAPFVLNLQARVSVSQNPVPLTKILAASSLKMAKGSSVLITGIGKYW